MITCMVFVVDPPFLRFSSPSLVSSLPISYLFVAFASVLFRFPKRGFSVGFAVESLCVRASVRATGGVDASLFLRFRPVDG